MKKSGNLWSPLIKGEASNDCVNTNLNSLNLTNNSYKKNLNINPKYAIIDQKRGLRNHHRWKNMMNNLEEEGSLSNSKDFSFGIRLRKKGTTNMDISSILVEPGKFKELDMTIINDIKEQQKLTLKKIALRERHLRSDKWKRLINEEKRLEADLKLEDYPMKFRQFSMNNHPWLHSENKHKNNNSSYDNNNNDTSGILRQPTTVLCSMVDVSGVFRPGAPLVLPPLYKQRAFQPRNMKMNDKRKQSDITMHEICKSRYLRIPKDYDPYFREYCKEMSSISVLEDNQQK